MTAPRRTIPHLRLPCWWHAAAQRPPCRAGRRRQRVAGLRQVIATATDEDGWASLGAVGKLMRKQQPDFNSRNWGYAKLSDLLTATDLFVIETSPADIKTPSTPFYK